MLFSKTAGRVSDILVVPPPLWSWCHSSLLAVDLYLLSKFLSPTFSQIGTPRPSSFKFVSSLGHLSGPVLLPGFKHIATYFLISWMASSPLKRPGWCSAVLLVSISNLTNKVRMPISPFLCLKFVECQHCWQKATNSRLFYSTVAWGRLACVLLALGDATMACTCCIGEYGESTPGTWEPRVEDMKQRAKGKED